MGKPLTYRNRDLGEGFTMRGMVWDGKVLTWNVFRGNTRLGRMYRNPPGLPPGWYMEGGPWLGKTAKDAAKDLLLRYNARPTERDLNEAWGV